MNMEKIRCCMLLVLAMSAVITSMAASQTRTAVAPGFLKWEGISDKNRLYGYPITPSDLRQRVVLYAIIDYAAFTGDQVMDLNDLTSLIRLPYGHVTWETQEMPHARILVFSVRNAPKDIGMKAFKAKVYPPSGSSEEQRLRYTSYVLFLPPMYRDLKVAGEADVPLADMPVVTVYGGEGTEPLYRKTKFSFKKDERAVRAALGKGVEKLLSPWEYPLGVTEPRFFKNVPGMLAKGKPAKVALKALEGGILSKDPAQAKEAQVMFDALYQYQTSLKLRIRLECDVAPACAYCDYQQLMTLFPSEKKTMQEYEARLLQDKQVAVLGKVFEHIRVWGGDDFVCANAGEAKKIVLELKKFKKALAPIVESPNAAVQGEAMLFQTQVDTLIETIPNKVRQ